jgi:uncharacterized protein (TIGR03086 family)
VSHVVTGNRLFAAALRGDQPAQPSADADLVVAFGDSGSEVLTAFASPGALERVVQVPFGTVPGEVALHLRITEILVHGWDIAAATGQRAEFDEAVAGQELEFSRGALGAIPPPTVDHSVRLSRRHPMPQLSTDWLRYSVARSSGPVDVPASDEP